MAAKKTDVFVEFAQVLVMQIPEVKYLHLTVISAYLVLCYVQSCRSIRYINVLIRSYTSVVVWPTF